MVDETSMLAKEEMENYIDKGKWGGETGERGGGGERAYRGYRLRKFKAVDSIFRKRL